MSDGYLTPDQVRNQLEQLTDHDILRIAKISRAWANGVRGWSHEDLIQEAIERALAGPRQIPTGLDFCVAIAQIINSLADQHRKRALIMESEEEDAQYEDGSDDLTTLENDEIFKHLYAQLQPESNAAKVLELQRLGYKREEICDRLSIDRKKYATAKKRIDRLIIRSGSEGDGS